MRSGPVRLNLSLLLVENIMRLRSLLILIGILGLAAPSFAIDIIDLHQNDASGVPTTLGSVVTVSGIVTSPNNLFSTYNLEIYVQDDTAGVNVWVSGGAGTYTAELGDSITVTGTVAQYSGLTELSSPSFSLVNHSSGHAVPAPLDLTCAELNASFEGDYSEPNEGRLVRLTGVSIVSGTWPIVPSGSNSFIDVTDGTATSELFIDKDSPVNGSADPGSSFDIVGILKQYDSSAPHNTGYELSPRFETDVVSYDPGPPINGPVVIQDLDTVSATLYFETATPGTSEIEYGLDDSYGMTAGDAGASELTHTIPLTGLSANTIYHFRAKSTDGSGTRYGNDQLLATANDMPGELHVYMSFTADETYADPGNEVAESVGLSSQLVSLINTATYSVDAQLYSFSLTNVRDALIAAHNRGCLVRLIIEDENSHSYADQCAAAGIPYITSTFAGNHSATYDYGLMHNKTVVIDGRDTDPYNDWIWTGSANMSISGNDDVNNAIKIQDYGLAQAYTIEFNEMWGGDTQTPTPWAYMGSRKADNTPHEFRINGIRIEQFMSPSDGVEEKLEGAAHSADHSIYFAILSFTNHYLANAMQNRRDDLGGDLEIRGVFDESLPACSPTGGSMYWQMSGDPCSDYAWSVPADVWVDYPLPSSRLLHHKYMIVDVNNTNDDPLVVTGSHNWSFAADERNDENTLIIHDQGVANMFLQEFAQRYHESGGTGDLGVASAAGDLMPEPGRILGKIANFPNPFNPFTKIAFTTGAEARLNLRIYDAAGRQVRELFEDRLESAGYHEVGWDGTNDSGRKVPSGVYFVQVDGTDPVTGHNEKVKIKVVNVQ